MKTIFIGIPKQEEQNISLIELADGKFLLPEWIEYIQDSIHNLPQIES